MDIIICEQFTWLLSKSAGDWLLWICYSIHRETAKFCASEINLYEILEKWIMKRGNWPTKWTCTKNKLSDNTGNKTQMECKWSYRRNSWLWKCWQCGHLRLSRERLRKSKQVSELIQINEEKWLWWEGWRGLRGNDTGKNVYIKTLRDISRRWNAKDKMLEPDSERRMVISQNIEIYSTCIRSYIMRRSVPLKLLLISDEFFFKQRNNWVFIVSNVFYYSVLILALLFFHFLPIFITVKVYCFEGAHAPQYL